MRQQLVDFTHPLRRQTGENVLQCPFSRADWIRLMIAAARLPLRSEPAKSQFLRLCRAWHNRKAWLFSDTPKGATASAQIYSLVETAKINGQEPYTWLRHVLERLPHAHRSPTTKRCCHGTARQRCHGKHDALVAVGVLRGSDSAPAKLAADKG